MADFGLEELPEAFADGVHGEIVQEEEDTGPITQEDCWTVVSAFFDEKGLVTQQIESFNEFVDQTILSIVTKMRPIEVRPKKQYKRSMDNTSEDVRYELSFTAVALSKPTHAEADDSNSVLFPHQARLRNLTYSARVFADVRCRKVSDKDGELEAFTAREEFIGYLPIMLRTRYCNLHLKSERQLAQVGECVFDQGGYFVINGSEKVVIAQERQKSNAVFVFQKKGSSKFSWVAEIRSVGPEMAIPSALYCQMYGERSGGALTRATHQIRVTLPYVHTDIPVVIVFRALGFWADRDVLEHICYDFTDTEMMERFRPSLEEAAAIQTQDVALVYIGRRSRAENVSSEQHKRYARELLQKDLLPHVSTRATAGNETKKAFFLGYIVHKLMRCSLGRAKPDDRDHMMNKRLDLAGPLLANQFRQSFFQLAKAIRAYMQKCVDTGKDFNVTSAIKSNIVSQGMKYALATGNWGGERFSPTATGVSQVLSRLTYASSLSHLRRLNTPVDKGSKDPKPRQLHNTQWGVLCPAETPEGHGVGLIKNLALMCFVSVGTPVGPVIEMLGEMGLESLDEIKAWDIPHATKVFADGAWVGIHRGDISLLVDELRAMRRDVQIEPEVSIVWDIAEKELRLYTDSGRAGRPLFIVEKGTQQMRINRSHIRQLKSAVVREGVPMVQMEDYEGNPVEVEPFKSLVLQGLVEIVDCEEEETTMIAMDPEDLRERAGAGLCTTFTHVEVHPSMILGVCASIIPFPDHNQSPRNTYQSAMGKQAMGVYTSNYQLRIDTLAHVLYYPQKPLVTTRAMQFLNFRELPAGVNVVVAIACYTGYNQEDSVIMNQSAVDRGLFRSMFYRRYDDVERPLSKAGTAAGLAGAAETFEVPMREECRLKQRNYTKLDPDGFVPPGEPVHEGDIVIGKTIPKADAGVAGTTQLTKQDSSTAIRPKEHGVVDKVMVSTDGDGNKMVKVRVRSVCVPQVGDKFSSRHGQKGTIGMLYREEDLPFTRQGVTPDIIVNPHAIPSRMTIGQLVECILGKVTALSGTEGDATAFTDVTMDGIATMLHEYGFQNRGNEVMFNGHTGRQMEAQIFIGPTYYQRLKHMVDKKIHSRARGNVTMLTRQPMEGRAKQGGLRMGEMERDCLIAHGAASLIKERFFLASDKYAVHVCDICGLIAIANLKTKTFECRGCRNQSKVSLIYVPYACKLLFQELMAMSITPRMMPQTFE